MIEIFQTEGIVLSTSTFLDYDQIVTVFCANEGLLKFILKGVLRPKSRLKVPTEPLTELEFIYTKKNSDLYLCKEASLVNQNLHLRTSLDNMRAAFLMSQALLRSQLLHEPATLLYRLFLYYLKKLPECLNKEALVLSFYLKILRHDGLLDFSQFTLEEKELIEVLSFCKSHADLHHVDIPKPTVQKIEQVFSVHVQV